MTCHRDCRTGTTVDPATLHQLTLHQSTLYRTARRTGHGRTALRARFVLR
ncbi:hypothetical protein [Actinokineospora enzanensis]|nr:hypothetical protein [Actinokineospora enzanensis]